MESIFKDFHISTNTNASFSLDLKDGELIYNLISHETESNMIYLEHKETRVQLEVSTKGDDSLLKELNEAWISMNGDLMKFVDEFDETIY